MALTLSEQRVVDLVASRERELVELLRELIAFDTRTHGPDDPARDEAALQAHLARRLLAAGALVELAEPDATPFHGHPMVPHGFTFTGRPQLVARFAGTGGGRSLLLNGHVDVVDVEPRSAWSVDPFDAVIRDGHVWGRGACDMKGGVAAMVIAAESLAEAGVALAGDLVVNTVTDEESTGAGGLRPREPSPRTPPSSPNRAVSPSGSRAVARCCRRSPWRAVPGTRASRRATRTRAGL